MTRPRPQVGIRTDATEAIGGGHVMRCLALAGELDRAGADVVFFVIRGSADVAPALGRSTFPVIELSHAEQGPGEGRMDAMVVDHYGLCARHEALLRKHCDCIAVIDDLADRPHDCDLLIDTAHGRTAQAYAELAPKARFLLGPAYALLRPAFARLRPRSLLKHARPGALRRVLVSFGLSDPGGRTEPAARTLLAMPEALEIDVALRRGSAAWAALERLAAESGGRLALHDDPPELADLMSHADIMIGAGGITSWERCCLGLPSVVARLADNQADNVAALGEAGAAVILEDPGDMAHGLEQAVRRLAPAETRRIMSTAAAKLCDGQGAARVAQTILAAVPSEHRLWSPAS